MPLFFYLEIPWFLFTSWVIPQAAARDDRRLWLMGSSPNTEIGVLYPRIPSQTPSNPSQLQSLFHARLCTVNPFPSVVSLRRQGTLRYVAGRPDGPCDPRAPVQSPWGPGLRLGLALGVPSTARGPQASLGSFRRSARTLALAVRVV